MRINKYLAAHTYLSRRQADEAVQAGRVTINRQRAQHGDLASESDLVTLDNAPVKVADRNPVTLLLNKPVGYVCSRNGQGSPTVYELIPEKYHHANVAGRLDKDSSGLVVMTSDGELLHQLTHPSNDKEKVYEIALDRKLTVNEQKALLTGVDIGDKRLSKFTAITPIGDYKYEVVIQEGRNHQIRRTIQALNSKVLELHRKRISEYSLDFTERFVIN